MVAMRTRLAAILCVALAAVAAGCPGCREERKGDDQPASSTLPPADVDTASMLGASADTAMGEGNFAAAADLFARAAVAVESPTIRISPADRFQWRCDAALAWSLAGSPDKAAALADADSVPGLDPAGQRQYLAAYLQAIDCYRDAGGPVEPGFMGDTVPELAPAIQVINQLLSGPATGHPSAAQAVDLDWKTLCRLPELLAAWSTLDLADRGGGLLADRQLALALTRKRSTTSQPDAARLAIAGSQPESRSAIGMRYHLAQLDVAQPAPRSGDGGPDVGNWLDEFSRKNPDWLKPGEEGSLVIGLRQEPGIELCVRVTVIGPLAASGGKIRLIAPDARFAQRLRAGLVEIGFALPTGGIPLDNQDQAAKVAKAIALLAVKGYPTRIQNEGVRCWVLPNEPPSEDPPPPPNAPPIPLTESTSATLIPLVAGWLAAHAWQAPAASQPHDPAEDDESVTPADQTSLPQP